MEYEERLAEAKESYRMALLRVLQDAEPEGQKFHVGQRVHIVKDLGPGMSHFPSDVDGTVQYTYAHAYGGTDVKSYCINMDGHGSVAWYDEHQLIAI